MKTITTRELLKLAQIHDPRSELNKMSYGDISAVYDKLEKTLPLVKDCRLFSILLELKHHILACEKTIRQKELEKIENLGSLQEIISYIKEVEKSEQVMVSV